MSGIKKSTAPNQQEYCDVCDQWYSTWEDFLLHKIQSNKHISCLFCGRDFKTQHGCSRHQHQFHAAEQDLKCAGCGLEFTRVGSYICHIEQEQCPVIHQSLFQARRAEREKAIKEKRPGKPDSEWVPTDTSSVGDGPLVFEDNGPVQTSWDDLGDNNISAGFDRIKDPGFDMMKDFPALALQDFKNGGSKAPDLLTGKPDKLNEMNLAWLEQKQLFPRLSEKPVTLEKPVAAVTLNQVTQKEELHPLDPSNPDFVIEKYFNPITEKFRCPWPGCKKLQNHKSSLIQHLRSPAHMNAKLRCPGCLRQYHSATALVQHAESQAVKCQIRDSHEYKTAVDQITGGFVDTAGRHEDDTVRYIAPAESLGENTPKPTAFQEQVANASASYWAKQEEMLRGTNMNDEGW